MSFLLPMVEKVGLQLLLEPQTSGVIFQAACTTVGTIYPAYQSFKAIEDKRNPSQDDQWLTYWVIYGMLNLAESTTDQILAKFPYYYHAKCGLLLWLLLPQTQGARKLYQSYLRPHLLRYQPKVDLCLDKILTGAAVVYSIYKVPIDQATALAAYGWAQALAFFKWFSDGKSDSTIASSAAGKPSQFLTR